MHIITPLCLTENVSESYVTNLCGAVRVLRNLPDPDWCRRLEDLADDVAGTIPERVTLYA